MLNGNTVPLPRREIDAAKLPGTVGATIPAPRAVESNAHVAAAAYLMKHADVTALAVVDGREPEQAVGMITRYAKKFAPLRGKRLTCRRQASGSAR